MSEVLEDGKTENKITFEVQWESFDYPDVLKDLVNGITKWEFLEKYKDSDFIHINRNSTVILGSHNLVELVLDVSWNPNEKITKIWTWFWNFWSLNELASFTWSKIWDIFRVLWWNLISITKECRDLHIAIMHFYEEWRRIEAEKQIKAIEQWVKEALPN